MLAKIETTNPFVIALQSPKLSEMKKSEAVKLLMDILSKTYFDAGQVMPGHDVKAQTTNLSVLCSALYDETQQFKFLRSEEIRLAFKNGVRGEYGEYFGLNIKTFYQWIKAWQNDEKRKNALMAIKEASEREYTPIMSKSEAEYEWKQTMLNQFAKFKETGQLECAFASFQFKEFEKLGLIKLTNKEKDEILIKAMDRVIESKKVARTNPKSKQHLNQLSDWLRRNEAGKLTAIEEEEIRIEARRMCILNYYKTIDKLNL